MLDRLNRQELVDSGIEKGREEGREEERFSIAQRMIDMEMSLADIVRATQLSLEDLAGLKG